MLKIKDNIDLEELEKFGFKIDKGRYGVCKKTTRKDRHWWISEETNKRVYDTDSNEIIISREDRTIFICVSMRSTEPFYGMGTNCYELGFLYDLIQAGLVEKVEE